MIEKIDINEVERNRPSGILTKLKGLDSNGNSVTSLLEPFFAASGIIRVKQNINPGEVLELKIQLPAIVLCQNYSVSHVTGFAVMLGDKTSNILIPNTYVGYTQSGGEQILIYPKDTGNSICVKNNTGVVKYVRAIFIAISI